MAAYLGDDLEFLEDDDFDFDGFDFAAGDAPRPNNQTNDTSAMEYRSGKDMQGIPWERLKYSRDQYRQLRLEEYQNYESLPRPHGGYLMTMYTQLLRSGYNVVFEVKRDKKILAIQESAECKQVDRSIKFYDFRLNPRLVQSTIIHFQKIHGARLLSRMQISTMAVKNNLMVAGGFRGELICKHVDQPGVAFCTKVTGDDDSITNAVEVYESAK